MSKRPKLALLPPITRPWPVAILAIDPAKKVSGAALVVPELPVGEAKIARTVRPLWAEQVKGAAAELAMLEIVARAQNEAEERGLELVAVAENWTGRGKFGGARTQRGLGEGFATWRTVLRMRGFRGDVVRVVPTRWYAAVIGGNKRRDDKQTVVAAMLRRFPRLGPDLGEDAAEAVAIGVWASLSGEVGMVVPAEMLRTHLRALRDPGLLAEIERRRGLVSSRAKARIEGTHAPMVVVDDVSPTEDA